MDKYHIKKPSKVKNHGFQNLNGRKKSSYKPSHLISILTLYLFSLLSLNLLSNFRFFIISNDKSFVLIYYNDFIIKNEGNVKFFFNDQSCFYIENDISLENLKRIIEENIGAPDNGRFPHIKY